MPIRAETHVAPHDPKYRERFERLRELVTLSTCPVSVQNPEAMGRVEDACRSIRDRAFAVGQPLLKQLTAANAVGMLDGRADEGIAAGFRRSATGGASTSAEVSCWSWSASSSFSANWFEQVVPVIKAPPEG